MMNLYVLLFGKKMLGQLIKKDGMVRKYSERTIKWEKWTKFWYENTEGKHRHMCMINFEINLRQWVQLPTHFKQCRMGSNGESLLTVIRLHIIRSKKFLDQWLHQRQNLSLEDVTVEYITWKMDEVRRALSWSLAYELCKFEVKNLTTQAQISHPRCHVAPSGCTEPFTRQDFWQSHSSTRFILPSAATSCRSNRWNNISQWRCFSCLWRRNGTDRSFQCLYLEECVTEIHRTLIKLWKNS